jgi:hypothetical protein
MIPDGWKVDRIVYDHKHGRYEIGGLESATLVVLRLPNWPGDASDRCHVLNEYWSAFHEGLAAALEAVRKDILRLDACTLKPSVHFLHHGHALCGLSGIPAYWPEGNKWAPLDQAEHATCEECKRVLAEAQP